MPLESGVGWGSGDAKVMLSSCASETDLGLYINGGIPARRIKKDQKGGFS